MRVLREFARAGVRNEFVLRKLVHAGFAERRGGAGGTPPPTTPALWRRRGGPGRPQPGPQLRPQRRGAPPGDPSPSLRGPPGRRATSSGHALPEVPAVRPHGHPERRVLRCPARDSRRRVPARLA